MRRSLPCVADAASCVSGTCRRLAQEQFKSHSNVVLSKHHLRLNRAILNLFFIFETKVWPEGYGRRQCCRHDRRPASLGPIRFLQGDFLRIPEKKVTINLFSRRRTPWTLQIHYHQRPHVGRLLQSYNVGLVHPQGVMCRCHHPSLGAPLNATA